MHPLFRALDLLRAPVPHKNNGCCERAGIRSTCTGVRQDKASGSRRPGAAPRSAFIHGATSHAPVVILALMRIASALSDWIRRLSSSTSFERGWARKGMYKSQTARSHCYQSRTSSRFFNMRGALVSCRW